MDTSQATAFFDGITIYSVRKNVGRKELVILAVHDNELQPGQYDLNANKVKRWPTSWPINIEKPTMLYSCILVNMQVVCMQGESVGPQTTSMFIS